MKVTVEMDLAQVTCRKCSRSFWAHRMEVENQVVTCCPFCGNGENLISFNHSSGGRTVVPFDSQSN